MTESKKAWVTPELIVLVRSKPEEAVLAACKGGTIMATSGSNTTRAGCRGKVSGVCNTTGAICSVITSS